MKEILEEFSDVPEISKAIKLTQEASFTPKELAEYDEYWDQVQIEKTIKSNARHEGRVEGVAEAKREIVLKMLAKEKNDDEIMNQTYVVFFEYDANLGSF